MSRVNVTKEQLHQLSYDTNAKMSSKSEKTATSIAVVNPTVLIVFDRSDLNAAAYHLRKSMETPLSANAIATVLVQESIENEFIAKVKIPVEQYGPQDASSNAKIVRDVTHEYLSAGVVTLHTFRTAKEAIALCAKESLKFANASIWNENHACAYELVAALGCGNFYLNCYQISLEHVQSQASAGSSFVTINDSYHYETLPHGGIQKSVVFPIGTIFAN